MMLTKKMLAAVMTASMLGGGIGCEKNDGGDDSKDTGTTSSDAGLDSEPGIKGSDSHTDENTTSSDDPTDDSELGTKSTDDSNSATQPMIPVDTDVNTDNEWGFSVSMAQTRQLDCPDDEEPFDVTQAPDMHLLCTFKEGDTEGVLYVEAKPIECRSGFWMDIKYGIARAEMSIDGSLTTIDDAEYTRVEPHNADQLSFVYGDIAYTYFHSDFNAMIRECHQMDCMKRYTTDGILLENGCECDRSLPIVCVRQKDDGSFPPLIDTFEGCGENNSCSEEY